MPAPRAEVGDFEVGDTSEGFDLFPDFGFGSGVEDLELEAAHFLEDSAAA